jgi:hypothetical protein
MTRKPSCAKRLLARRGKRVSVDDIRAIAAGVPRGMRTQMSDIITAVIVLLAVAFAITLGVLMLPAEVDIILQLDVRARRERDRRRGPLVLL